jgi:hypothetical protein
MRTPELSVLMNRRAGVIVVGMFFGSMVSAAVAQAPKSADWLPVDENAWAIVMEEPQAHLLRAQEDLSNKDVKGAAAEIRMAGTFLKIQEKRLAVSSEQLNELAKGVESNNVSSPKEVEYEFNRAVSVLDYRQALVPVMEGTDTLYIDEADYHLAQAKSRLKKKEHKAAAGDIRKAAAYLKLKALHGGEKAKSELSSSVVELEELARKVEDGSVTAAEDLDQAFERARKAVRRVL